MPFLSERQVEWAFERYCEGHSLRRIAEALYCSHRSVSREFQRRGLKRKYKPLVYDFKSEMEKEDHG